MREVVSVGGDDVPVWPLAYLCARSDDAAAAARVLALRRGGQPVPKLAALLNLQAQIKTGAAQGARSGALAAAVAEAAAEAGMLDSGMEEEMRMVYAVYCAPDPRASLGAPARPPARPIARARPPARARPRPSPPPPLTHPPPLPSPRRSRPDAVTRLLHHNRGLDVVQALDRPHVAPARWPRRGGRDGGDARHARHPATPGGLGGAAPRDALEELQQQVHEQDRSGRDPIDVFTMLLLTQQFERATAQLFHAEASKGGEYAEEALHFALVLHHEALLSTAAADAQPRPHDGLLLDTDDRFLLAALLRYHLTRRRNRRTPPCR